MMRIILFEIELDYWPPKYHTLRFMLLHFDWLDGNTSLLELGWYQGEFTWDFLFFYWLRYRVSRLFER